MNEKFVVTLYDPEIIRTENLLSKLREKTEELKLKTSKLDKNKQKKQIEINEEIIKTKEEEIKVTKQKLEDTKLKLETFVCGKEFFEQRKKDFFQPIKKPKFDKTKEEDLYKFNEDLCQVGNVVFVKDLENGYLLSNIYKRYIEENKKSNQIIFYIISNSNHWYLYIQQGKNIFKLNVSSIESRDNLELDKTFKLYKYNNSKDHKIQYSSGCCEMYCILLPSLITRLCFFNNIYNLEKMFLITDTTREFELPSVFFDGLCEKAFSSNLVKSDNPIEIRRDLLEVSKKKIHTSQIVPIYFSSKKTFGELFSKSLETEISYINKIDKEQEETLKLCQKTDVKGSFIYRYALFMSSIDPNYKKYLKEYIVKSFKRNKKYNEEEIKYLEKKFDDLFLKFNESFFGGSTIFRLHDMEQLKTIIESINRSNSPEDSESSYCSISDVDTDNVDKENPEGTESSHNKNVDNIEDIDGALIDLLQQENNESIGKGYL